MHLHIQNKEREKGEEEAKSVGEISSGDVLRRECQSFQVLICPPESIGPSNSRRRPAGPECELRRRLIILLAALTSGSCAGTR